MTEQELRDVAKKLADEWTEGAEGMAHVLYELDLKSTRSAIPVYQRIGAAVAVSVQLQNKRGMTYPQNRRGFLLAMLQQVAT